MPAQSVWDRWGMAAGRLDDAMQFRELVIYDWEREYDESTGEYDTDLVEQARIRGELAESSGSVVRTDPEGAGGEAEADVDLHLSIDKLASAGVTITAAGEQTRATVIEDTTDETRYRINETFDEDNGQLRCEGVEL